MPVRDVTSGRVLVQAGMTQHEAGARIPVRFHRYNEVVLAERMESRAGPPWRVPLRIALPQQPPTGTVAEFTSYPKETLSESLRGGDWGKRMHWYVEAVVLTKLVGSARIHAELHT